MTLFLHRGPSTDVLADALADLLAVPLADPFAQEVIAVPAKGVERWLAQHLSHTVGAGPSRLDGVCAGVRFLTPHTLLALVLGIDHDDPWHPDHLAWSVLRALDESLAQPWAAPVAHHLGHGLSGTEASLRRGRRYAVARRLAALFADYAAARPAMLADWRAGGSTDGLGGKLAEDLAWQPPLWRAVLEVVDAEPPDVRAERVIAELRAHGPGAVPSSAGLSLPGRLSLFGHTRIAPSEVALIDALAVHLDVHLWLPQASPGSWEKLAPLARTGPVPRDADSSATSIDHPLLASLGRDGRELQRTLAQAEATHQALTPSLSPPDQPTLLHLLQSDLAADRVPDPATRDVRLIASNDLSIQVHACHGPARQLDVLRDVLTGLLQADPTLEPRDILVMCPDIDTYAPLVHAGFGLGEVAREHSEEAHPAHQLRVRLADRGPLHTNPLLELTAQLVELAGGRVRASEVMDLAHRTPVRRRFGFDEDDVERLQDWVEGAAIRWGLDADHRADYHLPHLVQNTWRAGLDRMLVGAVVDGQEVAHLGTTLALDDLDSGDLELAGRLAELVDRLSHSLRALRDADVVSEWMQVLREAVLGLAEVPATDAWQVTQWRSELERIEAATRTGRGPSLALSDVRTLLTDRMAGRATRSNFRTGHLTVCTMVPMRSVPHRVIALVGLDDGVFPRASVPDGDDVLARRPVTGERDPRSEDRQLLLDAIMAARDHLVITYSGFDEHSGQEKPPAVPLGELLDAIRQTATGPGVQGVLRAHPLQPFDARNLQPQAPFSFDPAALAGARRAWSERVAPVPLSAQLLPPAEVDQVELSDLLRFFDNPARGFLRTRLGLLLPEVPEEPPHEGIPIELDGLHTWALSERVLTAVLAGHDPVQAFDAEKWRGELPPDQLGEQVLTQIRRSVQALCEAVWRVTGLGGLGQPLPREAVDVDVLLPSGTRVVGTVPGMVAGRALVVTYSTIRAKQRLRSWITSLALATGLGPASSAHVFGRLKRGRAPAFAHFSHGPHEPADALRHLDELVDLYRRGLRSPLPYAPATSLRWATSYLSGPGDSQRATSDAEREWRTNDSYERAFPKEQDDPSVNYVHQGSVPLAQILGVPGPDEMWTPGVDSRLGQVALRVWRPLLSGGAERQEWV